MRDDVLMFHIEFSSILDIWIVNLVAIPHYTRQVVCIPIPWANFCATLNKSSKVMDSFHIKDMVIHIHAWPFMHLEQYLNAVRQVQFNGKKIYTVGLVFHCLCGFLEKAVYGALLPPSASWCKAPPAHVQYYGSPDVGGLTWASLVVNSVLTRVWPLQCLWPLTPESSALPPGGGLLLISQHLQQTGTQLSLLASL